MALYIEDRSGNILSWHVGSALPIVDIRSAVAIQADGHELDLIAGLNLTLTPDTRSARVVEWMDKQSMSKIYAALGGPTL